MLTIGSDVSNKLSSMCDTGRLPDAVRTQVEHLQAVPRDEVFDGQAIPLPQVPGYRTGKWDISWCKCC